MKIVRRTDPERAETVFRSRGKSSVKLTITAILALSFLSTVSHAQVVEYVEGMRVGQGYDLINGKVRSNDCVKPIDPTRTVYPSQFSDFLYAEVINLETMRRFLQVDAAASYNAANGSGSGKAEFVNSAISTSSTSSYSFRHIVKAAERSADHWDYEGAKKRMASDPLEFKQNCGTHYIKAIVEGGEFYGLVTQSIKSEAERNSFQASANASFSSMSATNFAIQTEMERSSYSATTRIEGKKAGGSDTLALDVPSLRKAFLDFRTEVAAGKVYPITAFLAESPQPPVSAKSIALEESANLLLRYRDTENQLDAVESNPTDFYVNEEVSPLVVRAIHEKLRANKNLVVATMEKCKAATEKNAAQLCDLSRVAVAYPPRINQLAKLFRNTCASTFSPAPLEDGAFVVLPRVGGDGSMGGQDVAAVTIQYSGVAGGFVKRNMKLRIVETRGDHTQYAKESDSVAWSESLYPGCTLGTTFALPAEDVGSPFPLMGDGGTAVNDYMPLPYSNSKYLLSAVCRSNKQGEDDGFVGCKSFEFRPIQLDLRHAELRNGPAPHLSVPDWLASPSVSKAFSTELRGTHE